MEIIGHKSTSDVARQLGVSRRTLERWRYDGSGPRFLKINGRVKYRQCDIEAYEKQCLRKSTSEKAEGDGS